MSSKVQVLKEFQNFDCGTLAQFFEANGLEEFVQVIQINDINGGRLLEFSEFEISSWKPHITIKQGRKLWSFIQRFKANPQHYHMPHSKPKFIPQSKKVCKWGGTLPRPNISKEQLDNLCKNEEVINKLHTLLQQREKPIETDGSSNHEESFSSDDEIYVNQVDPKSHLLAPTSPVSNDSDDEIYINQVVERKPPLLPKTRPLPNDHKKEVYIKQAVESKSNPSPSPGYVKNCSSLYKDVHQTSRHQLPAKPKATSISVKPICKPATIHPDVAKGTYKEAPDATAEGLGFGQQSKEAVRKLPVHHTSKQISKPTLLPPSDDEEIPEVPAKPNLRGRLMPGRPMIFAPPPQEDEDNYLTPNVPPVTNLSDEEQVYELEPTFEEERTQKYTGAIQKVPLPPIPQGLSDSAPTFGSLGRQNRPRGWPVVTDADLAEALSRTKEILNASSTGAKQLKSPTVTAEVRTLPRPPKGIPNFNDENLHDFKEVSPDTTLQQSGLEGLSCYRYTDRKGSEMLLTEDLGDGSYLFRPSRQYHCTLSIRCDHKIYHIGVKQTAEGKLECLSSGRHMLFDTMGEICDHFKINPLTLVDNYNNYKSVMLRDVLPQDRT